MNDRLKFRDQDNVISLGHVPDNLLDEIIEQKMQRISEMNQIILNQLAKIKGAYKVKHPYLSAHK